MNNVTLVIPLAELDTLRRIMIGSDYLRITSAARSRLAAELKINMDAAVLAGSQVWKSKRSDAEYGTWSPRTGHIVLNCLGFFI